MKKLLTPYVHLFVVAIGLMGMVACGASKGFENSGSKRKPEWVQQRPTNTQYYVGIGYASKLSNPGDYQQVAKKHALDDMMGEIKVTVSSNSILSLYQSNQSFNQQFFSDTRMNASETMEGFQVMDGWENKVDYWIYYRMSKADYEAAKRKRLAEAINKSLDLLNRADQMDLNSDYVQILKLRLKAAVCLQNYLNESIETEYQNKNVFLLNEIFSQIQNQLFQSAIKIEQPLVEAVAGKPMEHPVNAFAALKSSGSTVVPLSYLPLKIEGKDIKFRGTAKTETQSDGSAQFAISSIQSKDPIQILQVKMDIDQMLRGDSINPSMKKLFSNLESPMANIRIKVEPIKVFMNSNELNMDHKMSYSVLEPSLKKKLMEQGCTFVGSKEQADYILELNANTKDQGIIWGNMLRATIELEIVLKDAKTQSEVLKDAIGCEGFQITKEKAGIEAYMNMKRDMLNKIYPSLESKLFTGE